MNTQNKQTGVIQPPIVEIGYKSTHDNSQMQLNSIEIEIVRTPRLLVGYWTKLRAF